jgi:hypothetical protein
MGQSTLRGPIQNRLPVQYRYVSLERERIDEKALIAEFSFSSDTPVERLFWNEILSHKGDAMKLNRAFAGKVPLLEDHDWAGEHRLGIIDKIWIENGTTGWARARFSANEPRAKIVWRDILDGIRTAVSVGYTLGEYEEMEPENSDDIPTIIVNDWEVLEISSVSVPADPSVGFGREQEKGGKLYACRYSGIRKRNMSESQNVSQSDAPHNGDGNNDPPSAQNIQLEIVRGREEDKKRRKEILAIGRSWKCEDVA